MMASPSEGRPEALIGWAASTLARWRRRGAGRSVAGLIAVVAPLWLAGVVLAYALAAGPTLAAWLTVLGGGLFLLAGILYGVAAWRRRRTTRPTAMFAHSRRRRLADAAGWIGTRFAADGSLNGAALLMLGAVPMLLVGPQPPAVALSAATGVAAGVAILAFAAMAWRPPHALLIAHLAPDTRIDGRVRAFLPVMVFARRLAACLAADRRAEALALIGAVSAVLQSAQDDPVPRLPPLDRSPALAWRPELARRGRASGLLVGLVIAPLLLLAALGFPGTGLLSDRFADLPGPDDLWAEAPNPAQRVSADAPPDHQEPEPEPQVRDDGPERADGEGSDADMGDAGSGPAPGETTEDNPGRDDGSGSGIAAPQDGGDNGDGASSPETADGSGAADAEGGSGAGTPSGGDTDGRAALPDAVRGDDAGTVPHESGGEGAPSPQTADGAGATDAAGDAGAGVPAGRAGSGDQVPPPDAPSGDQPPPDAPSSDDAGSAPPPARGETAAAPEAPSGADAGAAGDGPTGDGTAGDGGSPADGPGAVPSAASDAGPQDGAQADGGSAAHAQPGGSSSGTDGDLAPDTGAAEPGAPTAGGTPSGIDRTDGPAMADAAGAQDDGASGLGDSAGREAGAPSSPTTAGAGGLPVIDIAAPPPVGDGAIRLYGQGVLLAAPGEPGVVLQPALEFDDPDAGAVAPRPFEPRQVRPAWIDRLLAR